jgi:ABC-type transport system involved in multi-copper enzyme maturation permease subunit
MTTSNTAAAQTIASLGAGITANRPPFLGMVQAELSKIVRWRAIWFTLLGIGLLMLLLNALSFFVTLYSLTNTQGLSGRRGNEPPPPLPSAEAIPYAMMTTLLDAVRQYSGLVIAILAVMLIAAEFQYGTIRIVLGRGVRRVRLLLAKISAQLVAGLIALAVILALNFVGLAIVAAAQGKSDAVFGHIPSYLWSDAGLFLLLILYNLVVTMLFAMFVTVLSRSLAVGLVVALVYFLVEDIVSAILGGVGGVTNNKIWSDIPKYFLGNNLSQLALAALPVRAIVNSPGVVLRVGGGGGGTGGAAFDATHAIVVTLLYSAIFLGVSLYLMATRDVLQ